jgi:hypothetical protein
MTGIPFGQDNDVARADGCVANLELARKDGQGALIRLRREDLELLCE